MTTTVDPWLRCFQPAPEAPVRLLCLPHAGGSASSFFPVARQLAPRVEVIAVQYPGRQERRAEPCVESIEEMADQLLSAVTTLQDRPLALFGHSMGASVAFELARRMEAQGGAAAALLPSGRRAPCVYRDERNHLLSDDDLLVEVTKLDGTAVHLLDDEEVRSMVLPPLRSDYRAAEAYRYTDGPRLGTPIHAMVGATDPKATVEEARRWEEHTTGSFDLEVFPGGHFYLNAATAEVTAHIDRKLAAGAHP